MNMKYLKKICVMIMYLSLLCANSIALAHGGGRTDGPGGHHDNKNASGLGSYHYHCGGYPAHLHKNGVYGAKTKSAIEDFQKDEKMTINGKIKKALLKKLKIDI